jgi:hypothetical protein
MDPVTVKIRDIMIVLDQGLPNAWSLTLIRQRPSSASLLVDGVRTLRAIETKMSCLDIHKLLNRLLHIFHNGEQDDGTIVKAVKAHFMALAALRLVQAQLHFIAQVAPECSYRFIF